MKTSNPLIHLLLATVTVLTFASTATSARAQPVSIPDPGLNAAVRAALQIPVAPLTEPDMLTLTNLDASQRNVSNITGLETARNLVSLNLQINRLTNFSLPNQLTKLRQLNLSSNPLTNVFLPNGVTNLASLIIEGSGISSLALPAGLTGLTNLDLEVGQFSSFNLSNLTSLVNLDLGFNAFTNFSLPPGLTNLSTFYFAGNPLTNVVFPPGLSAMTDLNVSQNLLTSFTLPTGMTNLVELNLTFNQLTNLTLPSDLENLEELLLNGNKFTSLNLPTHLPRLDLLNLRGNQFVSFSLPPQLATLRHLDISKNPLTSITLPVGLTNLSVLRLSENLLTSLTLPVGMTNLSFLNLSSNLLTNVVFAADLTRLQSINLGGNQLTGLTLPAGLTNLTELFLTGNLMTNITLLPDMTNLFAFGFLGNPLGTFVLSEPMAAATNLADEIILLQTQGVSVLTFPLTPQLVRPLQLVGAFKFAITGPPGVYTILQSSDLTNWSVLDVRAIPNGAINYTDVTAQFSPRKFYRVILQSAPANMVFVSPNTFTMGSPTNELHRQPNEGPQTTVTLTRGFWIGKYEVTQGEYLAVTGTNPSFFPGDLSRPISSVSWPDATNYCWLLTQQERSAGRISPASQYRLPTEAEWECAARAGTSTRFSYGDDPDYISLSNHAWHFLNGGLTVHPVGQKLPNPWGLYDIEGNVWEWCQDWLGDLPGGTVTDPQGPPSNAIGVKVIRGGAYDFAEPDCRSTRRFSFGAHPALTDTDLGFRVVLDVGPH
jgi:formylglycine-generating enzyme required for sulfatase activity